MGKIGNFDTDADALMKRIAAHDKFGENDLNAWVFDSAGIESGMRVLDLGCGTGKQTLELLEKGMRDHCHRCVESGAQHLEEERK